MLTSTYAFNTLFKVHNDKVNVDVGEYIVNAILRVKLIKKFRVVSCGCGFFKFLQFES